MTREEAEKYAENMTYREAIHNLKQAKSVPYRKATFIKVNELLKALEQKPCKDAVSVASVFEIMGNLMSIPYDFDRRITEKDVSESMDKIRELPRVTPQKPKTGYLSIDDVMSVFDDFMCGEVDEEGTETFLEMLKDKSESEG